MRKPFIVATGMVLAVAAMGQGVIPPPIAAPSEHPISIEVYLDKPIGAFRPIWNWFGYDEINFTTGPNGRILLRELHDLSPLPVYIRAHHLLTSGDGTPELKWSSTNIYTEDADAKPVYDFKIVDGIFDAYRAAGVRPMVELGFMPKDLAGPDRTGAKDYQIHFPGHTTSGTVSAPPKDYEKWRELVRVLAAHLVQRYGREVVLQWYFEVWNEPDGGYWHGTPEEYWKLYDYAVAGLREALPGIQVGGPAVTPVSRDRSFFFFKGFLDHVNGGRSAANGKSVPLNFISFHAKGQPTFEGGKVRMGIMSELRDADRGFRLIAQYPKFRALPVILSEADPEGCAACSSRQNPANSYRNGTMYPTYTAVAYKAMNDLQDRYGVNLIAMLSWAFEFEGKDYFEGFRSLATNGIDKPVLNVFRMLGLMGGIRVTTSSNGQIPLDTIIAQGTGNASDIDALATRTGREAAVLVWNYHELDQPAPATPTTVTLSALPSTVHRVLVTQYRIDDNHSNAYTLWQQMGSPQNPTAEQYAALKSRDGLELLSSPIWATADNGHVVVNMQMPRNSVSLLQVRW